MEAQPLILSTIICGLSSKRNQFERAPALVALASSFSIFKLTMVGDIKHAIVVGRKDKPCNELCLVITHYSDLNECA